MQMEVSSYWSGEKVILFLFCFQQRPIMERGQLRNWSLLLQDSGRMSLLLWMLSHAEMEERSSLPSVSIPCHNEQRDKKKRYTVRLWTHRYFPVMQTTLMLFNVISLSKELKESLSFFRFTKCWCLLDSMNGLSSGGMQSLISSTTQWVIQ